MNILLVSSKYMPEYSGSGFRAHNLYKRLTAKDSDISLKILSGSETENVNTVYEYDGFTVNRISCKPCLKLDSGLRRTVQVARNFYSEYKATDEFLKTLSEPPDLIHIFGQNYVSATVLHFAEKNNIPVLIELCNEMDDPHHYVPFPFKMWISGRPSSHYKFICISERLKYVCLKNGVPEENIWCRPNPINEKLFKPVSKEKKHKIRASLTRFSEDDKLLVYVAKYIKRKNHRFLLDVIKHLPDEYKLFISGPIVDSGPNRDENRALFENIEKRIKDENLSNRVQAENGFCKDIEKYYQMADTYCFPTKAEGLGTPMLEAIACGVPVVANLIPGITDSWVKNGENGFTLELDPAKFAEKVIEAVKIPETEMAEQSVKIVSAAGTEVIDEHYRLRIESMTGNR